MNIKYFEQRTTKDEQTGCWNWSGATFYNGYGAHRAQGRTLCAHRSAFEAACGPIPKGMVVCHRCDNRRCVNPEHLFLGTPKENSADMVAKGRQARGAGHPDAKLTELDVAMIKSCLEAKTATQRALAARYGVTPPTIHRIAAGQGWRHVEALPYGQ